MLFSQLSLSGLFMALALLNIADAKYALPGVRTGINTQTGERPARRNILDLQKDVPSWSLYIQALTALQAAPENDLLSYFQLAGIHGRPYYSWDGYEQDPAAPLIGYCTHVDALFVSWHRPYLALFEQALASHAQRIAKTYNSPIYQTAADNLRIPYWDWAVISDMPDVTVTTTVQINTTMGIKTVPNPLKTYIFQQFPLNETLFPSNQDSGLSQYNETVRCFSNGASDESQANSALSVSNLMKETYTVFATTNDYNTMATKASAGNSFEYVHDLVHASVGTARTPLNGRGHMTSFSYSAFDPVFWLHHANVDRHYAMWQAIHPTSFLLPQIDHSGTFTIVPETNNTVSTPLTPFTLPDAQTAYTSTTARYTKDFGYSYPEIQDWVQRSDQELARNVTAQINALYNPNGAFGPPVVSSRDLSTEQGKKAKKPNLGDREEEKRATLAEGEAREWSVAIEAVNNAFGDYYTVNIYLSPSSNSTSINSSRETGAPDEGNKIGDMILLPPPSAITYPITTHHDISLSSAILKLGITDLNDIPSVITLLKGGLEWRVQKADGTILEKGDKGTEGVKIEVDDYVVRLPKDDGELSVYGVKTAHPEVGV